MGGPSCGGVANPAAAALAAMKRATRPAGSSIYYSFICFVLLDLKKASPMYTRGYLSYSGSREIQTVVQKW